MSESDDIEFWAERGTRVLVDPAHAFRAGRHPSSAYEDVRPYQGVVLGSRYGMYQVVDDDGNRKEAPADWLRVIKE